MNRHVAIALSLLLPAVAQAQQAEKFNAAQLEQDFAPLALFHQNGKVVDKEVILSRDPDRDSLQAIYVVRAKVEKVLEFYKEKLGVEPKTEGQEELGTLKYRFTLPLKEGDKRVFKVTVEPTDQRGLVQIIVLRRAMTEDDQVVYD